MPSLFVTLDRGKSVEAVFGTTFKSANVEHGFIVRQPSLATYPYGTSVKAFAVPGAAYAFAVWGADFGGNSNPLNVQVNYAEPKIAALFLPLGSNQTALSVLRTGMEA